MGYEDFEKFLSEGQGYAHTFFPKFKGFLSQCLEHTQNFFSEEGSTSLYNLFSDNSSKIFYASAALIGLFISPILTLTIVSIGAASYILLTKKDEEDSDAKSSILFTKRDIEQIRKTIVNFTTYVAIGAIIKLFLTSLLNYVNGLCTALGVIGHGILTCLGAIGHELLILGNWLSPGLDVMGSWLATNVNIMGAWLATNTVTIANLFYTAVVAHPAIAIAIPLLVLTASLIIDSCWKFFNSKGAYKVNGSDQPNSVGSDEISQKPDNFLANDTNRTDNSAQPASWPFSYLGF